MFAQASKEDHDSFPIMPLASSGSAADLAAACVQPVMVIWCCPLSGAAQHADLS
jgi:hypothetical protein